MWHNINQAAQMAETWTSLAINIWILITAFLYAVNGFNDQSHQPVKDRLQNAAVWAFFAGVMLGGAAISYFGAQIAHGPVIMSFFYGSSLLFVGLFLWLLGFATMTNWRFYQKYPFMRKPKT